MFSLIFLRDMCINSYHSPMTKRIFQMNSRKYQNTGGKVEVLPPPHSDPLYNEVYNSFLTSFFANVNLFWAFSSISAHYPSETSRKTGIYPSLYQKTHIAYISAYISAYFLTLDPSAGTLTFCVISQLLLNHFSSGLF